MKGFKYSYVAIRYVHDTLSGEALNVGVVLFAPEAGVLAWKLEDKRTHRLSEAFRDFQPAVHAATMADLKRGLFYLRENELGKQKPIFQGKALDAEGVMRRMWPDKGGRYSFSEASSGVAGDLEAALERVYERLVVSQSPALVKDDREKDDQVWRKVEKPLRERVNLSVLQRQTVATADGPVEVSHVFENGELSLFQPLSFDLKDESAITRKAHTWFGRAHGFARTDRVKNVLYLLGPPRAHSKMASFERALGVLREATKVKVFTLEEQGPFIDRVAAIVGTRN